MTKLTFIRAQLTARPLRTILTIGAFGLAAFMFVSAYTLLLLTHGKTSGYPSRRVVVIPETAGIFSVAMAEQVRRLPGVVDVEGYRYFRAKNYGVWAATDGFPITYPKWLLQIPPDVYQTWLHDRQGVIALKKVADQHHWTIGGPVTIEAEEGQTAATNVKVTLSGTLVGYVDGLAPVAIFHINQVMNLIPDPSSLERMSVGCEPSSCEKLPNMIDDLFENSPAPTTSMMQEPFFERARRSGSTIPDLISLTGLIIFAVSVVMTGQTLSINLRERSSELATMRALGFSQFTVFGLLAGESMIAGLLGGLVGAIPVCLITLVHPLSFGVEILGDFQIQPAVAALGVIVATVMGLLVCMLPVFRSLRQSISEGLGD